MTYAIGSACSGYGGLEQGLQLALGPGRVAWHIEYDKYPSMILAHHHPGVPNLHDVTKVDWSAVEPVDVLTAGFPCQDVSTAGKRAGLRAGTRTGIWSHIADGIGVLRPRLVLLENVRGLLSAGADSDVEPCPWCLGDADPEHVVRALGAVLSDLALLGYDARWGVVRASDAGAPHGRARVFIVAHPSGDAGRLGDGDGLPARVGWGVARPADADAAAQRRWRAEGEQCGLGATGLLADLVADADRLGHERLGRARDGWAGPADSGVDAPDSASAGLEGCRPECDGPGTEQPADRGSAPADADRRSAVWPMPRGIRPAGSPAPDDVRWGMYAPAIRRWERVLGRPAPRPTEPGRRGERLSPRFVEWLMGLPAGWVTDVPGLPRNAQLKALGNGVVPAQAALACRLLGVTAEAVAA